MNKIIIEEKQICIDNPEHQHRLFCARYSKHIMSSHQNMIEKCIHNNIVGFVVSLMVGLIIGTLELGNQRR